MFLRIADFALLWRLTRGYVGLLAGGVTDPVRGSGGLWW